MYKKIAIFSSLNEDELKLLMGTAVVQNYPSKDNIIFHAGDDSDDLYIVKSGRVNAVRYSKEYDQKIVISSFGPGEFFGEMSVLDGKPRSATVETTEPTVLLKISNKNLQKTLIENSDVNFELIKIILAKLRKATNQIEELVLYDVYKRTARLIDRMTSGQGPGSETDKVTHHQLGELVGASREMVSRSMSRLKKRGYIEVNNIVIKVLKKLPMK